MKRSWGVATAIRPLDEMEHVLVVQVEEQHHKHVAFLVSDPEGRQIDDRDATEEVVEPFRIGIASHEDL